MGRYCEGQTLGEMIGKLGTVDPAECTYCERAWSKGFWRCTECESHFGDDRDKPTFPKKNPGVEMQT